MEKALRVRCNYPKSIKKALLVGCNYPNRPEGWPQLKGCYNDVNTIHEKLITRYGFSPNDIQVLTDAPGSQELPTGINIKCALQDLIPQIGEGGILFFQFSGHGTQFPFEDSRTEEAIVPSDGNFITKMDFRYLVNRLPKGATFMFFADCRHSGDLFDQEKEQIGPNTLSRNGERQLENCRSIPYETVLAALDETPSSWRGCHNMSKTEIIKTVMSDKFGSDASLLFFGPRGLLKPLKSDQGILLSACQPNEQAYECKNDKGDWYGAFTLAVQIIIKEKLLSQPFSNKQLVMKAREIALRISTSSKQNPCLYCSDDNVHRNFLDEWMLNWRRD